MSGLPQTWEKCANFTNTLSSRQDVAPWVFKGRPDMSMFHTVEDPNMDDKTRTELEAAVFRRLVEHLRSHPDVQNIDLMNLAGFCRNCLSNWMKEAADAKGLAMSKEQSRETVYGMPYDEWRAKNQKEASQEQNADFAKAAPHRHRRRTSETLQSGTGGATSRLAGLCTSVDDWSGALTLRAPARKPPGGPSGRFPFPREECPMATAAAVQEQPAPRVAKDHLRAFVERIERLEEEKKAIADDVRDVYAEAKANGFDTKALRTIVRLRKQDVDERREQEAILETYMHALGMLA